MKNKGRKKKYELFEAVQWKDAYNKLNVSHQWKCRICGKKCKDFEAVCSKKCGKALDEKNKIEAQERKRLEELRRAKPATIGDIEDLIDGIDRGCNCC